MSSSFLWGEVGVIEDCYKRVMLPFTTIVAWLGKLLGVPTVKIFKKKCVQCGKEFRVFRK